MKKVLFILTMVLLLGMPAALRAQATLTVYDGITTNYYVPAYIYYFDQYARSQFIIPADSLADMTGGTIQSLKFYTQSTNVPYTTQSVANFYLMEVNNTSMTGFLPVEGATIVFSDYLDILSVEDGGELTIEFSTPFEYNGGNLLIGCDNTAPSAWKNIRFYGQTVSDAAWVGNSSAGLDNITGAVKNYIPKTTFTYTLTAPPACPKPKFLSAAAASHTVDLYWTPGGEEMSWQICFNGDESNLITANSIPYTINGLTPETPYTFKVRANCGDEYSDWSQPKSFTTDIACPAPMDLAYELTSGDGTVCTLNWMAAGSETEWQICLNDDENNLITVNTNPFTLTGLTPETQYTAKVRANCGSYDGVSGWSNTVQFTPTDDLFLTVNDGGSTSAYLPIYGYWADKYSKSQFIIPESQLFDLAYDTIKKMTFYASNDNISWGEAKFEVYMLPVNYTNFSNTSLVDWTSMDLVMTEATLAISDHLMEVTLTTPFQYTGGNLLIGFRETISGTYKACTWYGVEMNEITAIGGYENAKALSNYSFLPKTTFYYVPGEVPECVTPMWPTVHYEGGTTAEVSWNSDASAFNIDVDGTVLAVTESPYTLTGLDLGTTYTVMVQADCGNEQISDWSMPASFTTDDCMPDEKIVLNYTLNDSYGDGWNGNVIYVTGENCEELGMITLNSGFSGTGTLVYCGTFANFEWVQGMYSDEASWTFTDENGTVLFEGEGSSLNTGDVIYTIDYTPNPRPSNLISSEIGIHEATLSWTENGEATAWQIMLDGDENNLIDANSNPFTLTGLASSTMYTANVRSVGSDGTSAWICQPLTFTTQDACQYISDWQLSDITAHSVTLSWEETGEATSWVVAYKTNQETEYTEETVSSIPFTLSGLAEWTEYTVRVRPDCEDGQIKWTIFPSFTTEIACPAPTNVTATDITLTAATISWDGSADSYDLRYVEATDYFQDGWLHYDDDEGYFTLGTGGDYNIAVMFPGGTYTGNLLTKVAVYHTQCFESGAITVYNDGTTAPANIIGTINITNNTANYAEGVFDEYAFPSPKTIDPSKNLWIVLHVDNGGCAPVYDLYSQNDIGGYWISYNGTMWNYYSNFTAKIRAFVGDDSGLPWTEVDGLTANTESLSGLDPNTIYNVQVRSDCGEEGTSSWSSVRFTTHDLCDAPENLTASDITSCSALLSWSGWQDAYELYCWSNTNLNVDDFVQVGDDITTTDELTTYTFDLSAYSGTGTLAIRHYNVTNQSGLIMDDIVLTNATGEVVYSNNFEPGYVPYLYDYDNDFDGFSWGFYWNTPDNVVNGNCGYISQSMDEYSGALTPDDWHIIRNVELGGTLTLKARGLDPMAYEEVFGVFVTNSPSAYTPYQDVYVENYAENSYELEDLSPNVEYYWYVRGLNEDCSYYGGTDLSWNSFITSNCPVAATDLTAQATENGVLLHWDGGDDGTQWIVRYRPEADAEWMEEFMVFGHSYEIPGYLAPGDYVIELQSYCGDDNLGCRNTFTFNPCPPTYGVDVVNACGSYTWIDGLAYNESTNTPTFILVNAAGCDSVVTLNLTINNPEPTAISVSACGEYLWEGGNGETYDQDGTYYYSHQDANGCTQVDTLYLTINNPVHTATTAIACDSYIWEDGDGQTYYEEGDHLYYHEDANGCMQVDTLHLTLGHSSSVTINDVVCEGMTYAKYGFLVTPEEGAGTYYQYLTNTSNCDSTVTLVLSTQTCDLSCGNDVVDNNGNTYGTIAVNSLCWMTSNLRSTRYYDGVNIPFARVYSYPYDPANLSNQATYGRLYDWASASRGATAQPIQGACPEGWRLPSQAEFSDLISSYSLYQLRSTSNWLSNNGSNESSFNMQPGGYYNSATDACERMFGTAYFYTSDMVSGNQVIHLYTFCGCDDLLFEVGSNLSDGYSVRCVKDIE